LNSAYANKQISDKQFFLDAQDAESLKPYFVSCQVFQVQYWQRKIVILHFIFLCDEGKCWTKMLYPDMAWKCQWFTPTLFALFIDS